MSGEQRSLDIFQMLRESAKKKRREEKARLLESLGLREYFEEGSIRINMRICKGVDCRLCIEACPTNALYWGHGEVGAVEDLCVYCTACVLSCIVDDCIQVTRKRPDGKTESYGTASQVFRLLNDVSSAKMLGITKRLFPSLEKYIHELLLLKGS